MKRFKKVGKKGMVILAIFVVGAVVAGATAFTYFMQTSSEHQVGKLWQIKDDSSGSMSAYREMGNDDITFDTTDMVGGDSEFFTFNISLSGQSNANRDIVFDMTNNYEADGVTFTITEVGEDAVTDLEAIEWAPNTAKEFTFQVSLDEYTPEGIYSVSLSLEKN